MSPIAAFFSLLIIIAIPSFAYAFFFATNCPRLPLERFGWASRVGEGSGSSLARELSEKGDESGRLESVPGVRFTKEEHGEEYGSECSVCLSAFGEGDYVRLLNGCKHLFHVQCIDKWLFSHASCPVCRASVFVMRSKKPPLPLESEVELRQSLPDAASVV